MLVARVVTAFTSLFWSYLPKAAGYVTHLGGHGGEWEPGLGLPWAGALQQGLCLQGVGDKDGLLDGLEVNLGAGQRQFPCSCLSEHTVYQGLGILVE